MALRLAIARRTVRVPRPAKYSEAGRGPSGRGLAWTPVESSWIDALRFVPTGDGTARSATGYIDMRTRGRGRRKARAYRYGPGISRRQFDGWVAAASRGRYWWRYFTRRWSPAQPLY